LREPERDRGQPAATRPPAPMRTRIRVAEDGSHPDFAVTDFGGAARHVVCPQIEGAATREIEGGVVPVTGQGAVLDAAAIQGKAHMRAAIVEREDMTFVVDDEYSVDAARARPAAPSPSIPRGCSRARNPSSVCPSAIPSGKPLLRHWGILPPAPGHQTLEGLAAHAIRSQRDYRSSNIDVMPRPLRHSSGRSRI